MEHAAAYGQAGYMSQFYSGAASKQLAAANMTGMGPAQNGQLASQFNVAQMSEAQQAAFAA